MPEAVLIRALEPVAGVDAHAGAPAVCRDAPEWRLCRGPGALCQALGIDRVHGTAPTWSRGALRILDAPRRARRRASHARRASASTTRAPMPRCRGASSSSAAGPSPDHARAPESHDQPTGVLPSGPLGKGARAPSPSGGLYGERTMAKPKTQTPTEAPVLPALDDPLATDGARHRGDRTAGTVRSARSRRRGAAAQAVRRRGRPCRPCASTPRTA